MAPLTLEFKCNDDVKQEIQDLIASGEINFKFEINQNVFTANKNDHENMIDELVERYPNYKNELSNVKKTSFNIKTQKIEYVQENSRKYKIFAIAFKGLNENENIYAELSTELEFKSSDEAQKYIRLYKDEIASIVLAKSENNYNKFKTIEESGFFTCQCDVKINGIPIRICIDTGCDDLKYTLGVGGRTKIHGTCKTFIEFESIKIPITFEIGGDCSSILIGCNFLKKYKALINFMTNNMKLTVNGSIISVKLIMYSDE
ncbi:40673_t:CDS:2 [Gigaspora margarita]|uniref:40673_t:CDS:1 n=1 Tax=Gigaspora margarita TaxID=4874 RepID=A0ABN7WPT6_GIGMA|nr:40673_t:CDS:2 [Gigaspora margarita]